jgi:hypothetical protein
MNPEQIKEALKNSYENIKLLFEESIKFKIFLTPSISICEINFTNMVVVIGEISFSKHSN